MEIRRLREPEIPRMVDELWLPFAREMADLDAFDELAPDARRHAIAYRRNQFDRDGFVTWVAEAGDPAESDALLGLATAEQREAPPVFARGDSAYIHDLYVVPDRRGEGMGSRLLDRIEGWAANRDLAHIGLSVNVANPEARAFYESRGFESKRTKMVKSTEY
ncbi:MAG: GNAT family N-acetyltransferase [Halodesulfurarchaeum sp.]